VFLHIYVYAHFQKSLNIQNEQSEIEKRRTDNTMAKQITKNQIYKTLHI